jgi:hypothetical protein
MFSCEVYFVVSDFNQNLRFLTNFSKIPHYQIWLKSVHWFPSHAGTDGQTDMAKLRSPVLN